MDSKPSFFTVLPAFVRYNSALSHFDKLLYAEITALTNANNYCWASNGYFQKVFDCSASTVKRSISRLIEHGFIFSAIDVKNGNRRILTLNVAMVKNDPTPRVKNEPFRARVNAFSQRNTTRGNTKDTPRLTDWLEKYEEEKE